MSVELKWIEPAPIEVPQEFRDAIGGHPLVAETLYRRGIHTIAAACAFMDADAYTPSSPDELPDAHPAYELLTQTIHQGRRILIWGDFDVDGQTATTILVEALRGLNADVRYHIPVRGEESHGITASVLQDYLSQGFDLLVTCDTGITEHENVQLVRDSGIPVLITDHHTLGETLPNANAIVNPQRLPESHPLRTLPGVGVTYLLMQGLYHYLTLPFDSTSLLPLVALGIVADLAELKGDTRYLLQKGLEQLRQTGGIGLQSLFKNAELNPANLDEGHIGFQIAPRMNAIGRLGDANVMVEFLTTADPGTARVLGSQIEGLNDKRRFLTRQVEQAAKQMLDSSVDDRYSPAIVLHHSDWPGGIIGIVAGRLTERHHKPTIVLTGHDPIHGSARSIPGVNITEAIRLQAELLTSSGGHPMAAGLSFPAESLNAFKRGFLSNVADRIREAGFTPEIEVHQTLTLEEINAELVNQMRRLAPFGQGNPPLNFMIRDLHLESSREVGQTGEHRQVVAADAQGNQQTFIWWNGNDEPLPEAEFDLICQLSMSDYRGTRQISAEWKAFRLSAHGLQKIKRQQFNFIDERGNANPVKLLEKMAQGSTHFQIWGEGSLPDNIQALKRHQLAQSETLVIWTVPPSQKVVQSVIRTVEPDTIVLVAREPGIDTYQAVKNRLAGLVKYALQRNQGETTLTKLAAACATTNQVIRSALQLWQALGSFTVRFDADQIHLAVDATLEPDLQNQKIFEEILRAQLEEINAFRRFFARATITSIWSDQTINVKGKE